MARIILAGWGAVVLVVIGGVLGFFFYTHFVLGLTLADQRGTLILPAHIKATVKTTREVAIGLNGRVAAEVPVKQTLAVSLHGRYKANLNLRARTPLKFTIDYRGEIPVHASAVVQGTTDLVIHSKLVPKFPLKIKVPLDFKLPVHLVVPVDTMFDLDYRGPVFISFNQTVRAPVDAVLHTHLNLDKIVNTPITSAFGMVLEMPHTPLPMVINHAQLALPLSTLRLETAH